MEMNPGTPHEWLTTAYETASTIGGFPDGYDSQVFVIVLCMDK